MIPNFGSIGGAVIVLLSLLCAVSYGASTDNKYVNVAIKSNWNSTPIHLEASEYFASESEELFWEFVRRYHPSTTETKTDDQVYKKILQIAEVIIPAAKIPLLKLSLSLHTYSPKVEMYRQLAALQSDVLGGTTQKSGAWVQVGTEVVNSHDELVNALSSLPATNTSTQPAIFEFDHLHHFSSPSAQHHVILYADIAQPEFIIFHKTLSTAAEEGKIRYVLRHLAAPSNTKINLQGYGVDVAIKNVEYKAMDDSKVEKEDGGAEDLDIINDDEDTSGFLFKTLKNRKPHLANQFIEFKKFLQSTNTEFDALKVWDFKDLGVQASQKIVASSDPLRALRDISQNFPSVAPPLTRLRLNNTLKQDITYNQQFFAAGENIVLVNNRIIESALDAFRLVDALRDEISKVESLRSLKLGGQTAIEYISYPLPQKVQIRFNLISDAILYVNNMETDSTYSKWPRSITDFLRRVYPGQMRYVAKNIFTAVITIDPSSQESLTQAVTIYSLINQNLPVRVGFLIIPKSDVGYEVTKLAKYFEVNHQGRAALGFLNFLWYQNRGEGEQVTVDILQASYHRFCEQLGIDKGSLDEILKDQALEDYVESTKSFAASLGLAESGLVFVNGLLADPNKDLSDAIIDATFEQTWPLQNMIQQGQLRENSNIYETVLASSQSSKRYNKYVIPTDQAPIKVVDLVGSGISVVENEKGDDTVKWELLGVKPRTSRILGRLKFLEKSQNDVKIFSYILVVDLQTTHGVTLAKEALKHTETSDQCRAAIVIDLPEDPLALTDTEFSAKFPVEEAIVKAGSSFPIVTALLDAQLAALTSGDPLTSEKVASVVQGVVYGKSKPNGPQQGIRQRLAEERWWSHTAVGAKNAFLLNGRLIETDESTTFKKDDFDFLEAYQKVRWSSPTDVLINSPVLRGVEPEDITSAFLSDLIMRATSLLALDEKQGTKRKLLTQSLRPSFESDHDEPSIHISAILDPLSKGAQKFSPILMTLKKLLPTKMRVYLNPQLQLSDLPLKRYYHYLFNPELEFDAYGQLLAGPTTTISTLPLSKILTLTVDTPESWLVQPIVARYDLDNIKLEDLGEEKVLTAIFELEHILVEGNCYDLSSLQWGMPTPPRGLELVLDPTINNTLPSVDTLVMSNFGYFQLKANPGVWKLRLAEGRGSSIFKIHTTDATESSEFKWVVLFSFLGAHASLQVERKEGMKDVQLLIDEESTNVWDSISGLWQKSKNEEKNTTAETIHIFSVASGHLYERLLRIMILSVVKNTKNPVKFWFLKNFLSPKVKELLPLMAKEYNFEVELVTYKWPSWLRIQTEKQRFIWGYKILFLDVLFPLGVKKIIFVDADQVVRTDIKELYDMDLDGAPLAYTPFCDNKPEMDGFRFWKQGYWKDHLRGRPYHISALYVIDLHVFRRTAAGDQLRSTYEMLSRDPNSLANLDQDLPNYLQHTVRIFSLPQEWLYCETWCSDEAKAVAKTVDLCNNPLTKKSKLENAVKILGDEWINLDNEVKEFETRVLSKTTVQPVVEGNSEAVSGEQQQVDSILEQQQQILA